MEYFSEIDNNVYVKGKVCENKNQFVPGIDNFLKIYIPMYLAKYGNHRNSLIFFLIKSYVAKSNGNKNPGYGKKLLILFHVISANDKREFGFVS